MLFFGTFSKSVQRSCFLAQTAALVASGGSVPMHLYFLASNVYSALRQKPISNTTEGEAGHPPAEDLCLKSYVLPSGIIQVDPRGLPRWTGTSGHPHVQHLALGQLQQADEF